MVTPGQPVPAFARRLAGQSMKSQFSSQKDRIEPRVYRSASGRLKHWANEVVVANKTKPNEVQSETLLCPTVTDFISIALFHVKHAQLS